MARTARLTPQEEAHDAPASEAGSDVEKQGIAVHRRHQCTDVPFCFAMLLAIGAQAYLVYSNYSGLEKTLRVQDWKGVYCGEGANQNKSYTYWCYDFKLADNVAHGNRTMLTMMKVQTYLKPICVEECPTSDKTSHMCYNVYAKFADPPDANASKEVKSTDMPTDLTNGLCLPRYTAYAAAMLSNVDRLIQLNSNSSSKMVNEMVEKFQMRNIANGWCVLAGAGVLALVTSWAYLHLLDHVAGTLVKVSAILAVIAPLVAGFYFIHCAQSGKPSGFSRGLLAGAQDLGWGVSLLVLGVVLMVVVCKAWRNLKTAVAIVEAGCECVFDEWTMLLEPFLSSFARVAVIAASLPGLVYLFRNGTVETVPGSSPPERVFKFTPEQWAEMGFYGFMTWWMLEYVNSSSQYALAWVTKSWYFTPYVKGFKEGTPSWALFQGLCNLFAYHLGTIALGSFLIALLRPIRMVLNILVDIVEYNPATVCLGAVCKCGCLACDSYLGFLSKNTYMDVAIYSTPFFEAAHNAHVMVNGDYFKDIFVLNSVQFIFQLGGVGIATAIGAYTSLLLVHNVPTFSDPAGDMYISDPSWVVIPAAVLSFVIGFAFMVVFDMVTDTMFYCYIIDEYYLKQEGVDSDDFDFNPLTCWRTFLDEDSDSDDELGKGGQPKRAIYAPYELREFMEGHGKHAAAGEEQEQDGDA